MFALTVHPAQAQQQDTPSGAWDSETAPYDRSGREDPAKQQDLDELLWELDDEGLRRSNRSSGRLSDTLPDPLLEDLKSLMEEVNPQDGFDLPVIVEDEEFLERNPARRGATAQEGPPSAGGDTGAPAPGSTAGSGRSTTIGEAGNLLTELVSDSRIYINLAVALAAIAGIFGVAAVFRHLKNKKGRRRRSRHGRGRHGGLRHHRSRRSASRRRRPAHT